DPTGTCVECLDADDCDAAPECQVAVCSEAGACDTANATDGNDCAGGTCGNGTCVPTPLCSNMAFDPLNGETAEDCGGPNCPACDNAEGCLAPGDCLSGVCTLLFCEACDADTDCQGTDFCDLGTGTCEPALE